MAAGADDKTEAPTPKRKREARKEGQIAKSTELAMWLQMLAASIALKLTMGIAYEGLRDVTLDIQTISEDPDPLVAIGLLGRGMGVAVAAVIPLALIMAAIGVVASLSQTGLVLATKAVQPKFSKANPIKGIQRLVKPQGLWQGAKAATKVLVLAYVSWGPIFDITRELLASGTSSITGTAATVVSTAVDLVRTVSMIGLVLAAADYAILKKQTMKSMRMSKKDIREEHRSQEGDPQMRSQIRRRQQDMSRNRMLAAVPDADVVIVNPTHIAVAIKYEAGKGAPRVVAKGRGLIADRIREEAAKAFVPIVRDVALARTLEKACKVDQSIPGDLYEAVARLLAFVMQVGRRASLLGGVLDNPNATKLPVPELVN